MLVQKLFAFYETRRFSVVINELALVPYPNPVLSCPPQPHTLILKSTFNNIVSAMSKFSKWSLGFKLLCAFLVFPTHSPSYTPSFYHPKNRPSWWPVQIMTPLIMQCSLLCPNVCVSILFSVTINLCSSLMVRDQVPYPHTKQRAKRWTR
jgi:hypothetical protein